MKKFILLLAIFLISTPAWATNKFARTAGGNWNTDATWSTTSGGTADTVKPTSSDDVFLDANSGQVTIDAASVAKSLTCTGYTNTLTHNAGFTLTVSGSVTLVSGMTYTLLDPATSALAINATGTLTTGTKTVGNLTMSVGTITLGDDLTSSGIVFTLSSGTFTHNNKGFTLNGAGAAVLTGTLTFYNLTRTGTTAIGDILSLANDITVTHTLTLNGNSASKRLKIASNTAGTARTITNSGATMTWSNVSFIDITLGTAYDCSAITGGCGNIGGNTNFTFTTPVTRYWVGGTGNYSDSTNHWSASSGGSPSVLIYPLVQDTAKWDSSSGGGTVTFDEAYVGNIDFSSAPSMTITAQSSGNYAFYGSVTLASNVTVTANSNNSAAFLCRGSCNLTFANKSFATNGATANSFSMVTGTVTLQDNYGKGGGTGTDSLNSGTLDANGHNFTSNKFNTASGSTLIMGSGTWTMTSTATCWSNLSTTTAGASTLVISNTSSTAKTFAGGGNTYNIVTFSGDNITITGANTFTTLNVNNAGLTNGLIFPISTTQTITNLNTNGSSGNLAIIKSSSSGTAFTLSKSSGYVNVDFMSIKDSAATGGALFFAGDNSTSVSGNTGWNFFTPGVRLSNIIFRNFIH